MAFFCSIGSAAGAELKWKLAAGESGDYVLTRSSDRKINFQGNDLTIAVATTADLSWKVESVTDGKATVLVTVKRLQIKIESPFAQLEFDSAGEEPDEGDVIWAELKGRVQAVVGSQAKVIMTESGKIDSVEFPKEVTEAFAAPSVNPQVARFMAGAFDETGMKNVIKQAFAPLPDGPADAGATWSRSESNERPPLGSMHIDTTYTYGGAVADKQGVHLIKVSTKIEFKKSEGENAEAIELKLGEQKGEGTIHFDALAGRTVESDFTQTMKLDIVREDNEISQTVTEKVVLRQGVSPPAAKEEKEEEKEDADAAKDEKP